MSRSLVRPPCIILVSLLGIINGQSISFEKCNLQCDGVDYNLDGTAITTTVPPTTTTTTVDTTTTTTATTTTRRPCITESSGNASAGNITHPLNSTTCLDGETDDLLDLQVPEDTDVDLDYGNSTATANDTALVGLASNSSDIQQSADNSSIAKTRKRRQLEMTSFMQDCSMQCSVRVTNPLKCLYCENCNMDDMGEVQQICRPFESCWTVYQRYRNGTERYFRGCMVSEGNDLGLLCSQHERESCQGSQNYMLCATCCRQTDACNDNTLKLKTFSDATRHFASFCHYFIIISVYIVIFLIFR